MKRDEVGRDGGKGGLVTGADNIATSLVPPENAIKTSTAAAACERRHELATTSAPSALRIEGNIPSEKLRATQRGKLPLADSAHRPEAVKPTRSDHDTASTQDNAKEPHINPSQFFKSGPNPIHLKPGDMFTKHPVAQRFRRTTIQVNQLTESIRAVGQQLDVRFVRVDGDMCVVDGLTRIEIMHGLGLTVRCRELSEEELAGRTLAEFILETNCHKAGRNLTDTQRAMQVVDIDELVNDAKERARLRSKGGVAVNDGEKCTTHEYLGSLANTKPIRITQAIELKKLADQILWEKTWNGLPISKAVSIAKLPQPARQRAVEIADKKEKEFKEELATLLNTEKALRDADGIEVPPSLARVFEVADKIKVATTHIADAEHTLTGTGIEQKYFEELESLRTKLLLKAPRSLCDECEGTGRNLDEPGTSCPRCAGKRYVTAEEWEAAKAHNMAKFPKAR